MTENQNIAIAWWNNLSINEWKALNNKYLPELRSWWYCIDKMNLNYIEDMHDKEHG
jgi:hypothetical protein